MFSKKAKKLFTGWQFNESGKECWCSVTQLCPTLHNPMDCSLTGSSVHGISHARILEWVAIFYTRDLPDQGIKPAMSPALAGGFFTTEPSGKPKQCWKEKKVKVAQSCLTFCDPMDYTVHGIL